MMRSVTSASAIMTAFKSATGLSGSSRPPQRYLWTDAFAVCNLLALYRQTEDTVWLESALELVDQVMLATSLLPDGYLAL